jgi:predicted membrane metal-binding protein
MPVALIHGAIAAAGLVALLIFVLANGAVHNAGIALVLFAVAALGGFFLFSFHLRNKPLPIPVMAVHALVAVAGFALLLLGVLEQG